MRKLICPHCGAENPSSFIITTCGRCGGSLEGAQAADSGVPPPPPPPMPAAPLPCDLGEAPEPEAAEAPPSPAPPPVVGPPAPVSPPAAPGVTPPASPGAAVDLALAQAGRPGKPAGPTTACCACSGVAALLALVLAVGGIVLAAHAHSPGPAMPMLFIALVFGAIGLGMGIWGLRRRLAAGYYDCAADGAPSVGLGDSAQWGVTVSAKRAMDVGTVSCTLRCQEHAISRGGTSDSHYRKTLYEQHFQVPGGSLQPGQQASFRVPFTIPPDAVPSHRSSNNFVEWRLELHAPVPGMCPDIKQTLVCTPRFPAGYEAE